MNLNLELNSDIYDHLVTESDERGITVSELVRWIIGDYARFRQPPSVRMPLTPFPLPGQSESDKLLKLSGMFIKSMIKQGGIKCSDCTMPLSIEDIEAGKCSKCDAEI